MPLITKVRLDLLKAPIVLKSKFNHKKIISSMTFSVQPTKIQQLRKKTHSIFNINSRIEYPPVQNLAQTSSPYDAFEEPTTESYLRKIEEEMRSKMSMKAVIPSNDSGRRI